MVSSNTHNETSSNALNTGNPNRLGILCEESAAKDSKNKKNTILDFFNIIERAVRNHSPEKVSLVLQNMDIQSAINSQKNEAIVQFIIKCVLHEFAAFKIKKRDLFSKVRRGEVTIARKLAMILMKEFTDISDANIGSYFGGRSRQIVFYAAKEYQDKNTTHKVDVSFLSKYTRLSEKVELFIKQSNIN